MEEEKFIIGQNLANAILQYLGNRPYIEVFQMIDGLKQVQKLEIANTNNKAEKPEETPK